MSAVIRDIKWGKKKLGYQDSFSELSHRSWQAAKEIRRK